MTTWGDLRAGDVILDKTDVPWTVVNDPERDSFGAPVRVTIRNEAGRSVPVVKPASEPVTLATHSVLDHEPAPDEEQATARSVLNDAFGEDKVSLIASETTDEKLARDYAKAWDKPVELPQVDHPATLRSHLYLFHDFFVADVDSTLALKEHHRKQHADFPDQGTPHTHDRKDPDD